MGILCLIDISLTLTLALFKLLLLDNSGRFQPLPFVTLRGKGAPEKNMIGRGKKCKWIGLKPSAFAVLLTKFLLHLYKEYINARR